MPSENRLTIFFASISATSAGDNTIVLADSTRKIKVLSYTVVASGTVATTWKSGSATALSGSLSWVANTGVSPAIGTTYSWLMETAVNEALVLNLNLAATVGGHLSYFLEDS